MKTTGPINEKLTSGKNHSYWIDSAEPLIYNKLSENKTTDVLVIGGGLAGLTTAYCLVKSGKKVILIEDGYLGSGESGRTTAHITFALDDRYYDLEKIYGFHKTQLIALSHENALEWIESVVTAEEIDCNFKRVEGYLFSDPTDSEEHLLTEYDVTRKLDLPTKLLSEIPFFENGEDKKSICFHRQGQFHILKYLKGLAEAIIKLGGEIYTESKAKEISKTGAKGNGFEITAANIVVATNTPINDWVEIHTKQTAYTTYVIGAKIPKGVLPYAMWWDTGNQKSEWIKKPYHYVRLEPFDKEYDLLISGGEDHKTALDEKENITKEQRIKNLIKWTKIHYPYFTDIQYEWSGQVMEPVDSIAFIGKNPGDDNIYIITGDSGNGMTHCTIGGLLIHDLILGIENPIEKIYSPSRITFKTGDDYMHEMGAMVGNMARGWFTTNRQANDNITHPSQLTNEQGAVLTVDGKKVAYYRDENGNLHSCSAVCTHLYGIVQWNNEEKSFDCPLHGSRFTPLGHVMHGPANYSLKKKNP